MRVLGLCVLVGAVLCHCNVPAGSAGDGQGRSMGKETPHSDIGGSEPEVNDAGQPKGAKAPPQNGNPLATPTSGRAPVDPKLCELGVLREGETVELLPVPMEVWVTRTGLECVFTDPRSNTRECSRKINPGEKVTSSSTYFMEPLPDGTPRGGFFLCFVEDGKPRWLPGWSSCVLPKARASRTDPIRAMRYDGDVGICPFDRSISDDAVFFSGDYLTLGGEMHVEYLGNDTIRYRMKMVLDGSTIEKNGDLKVQKRPGTYPVPERYVAVSSDGDEIRFMDDELMFGFDWKPLNRRVLQEFYIDLGDEVLSLGTGESDGGCQASKEEKQSFYRTYFGFKNAVAKGDAVEVASYYEFPLTVWEPKVRKISKKEFVEKWFVNEFVEHYTPLIQKQELRNIRCDSEGYVFEQPDDTARIWMIFGKSGDYKMSFEAQPGTGGRF